MNPPLSQFPGWKPFANPLQPAQVAASLVDSDCPIFLDTSTAASTGAMSLVTAAPTMILRGNIEHDWQQVTEALKMHGNQLPGPLHAPSGGLFGWVGFDGEFRFGVYPHVLAFDHDKNSWMQLGDLDSRFSRHHVSQPQPALHFEPIVPRDQFVRSVQRAQQYIAAGDIYQVNLAHPWNAKWPAKADAFAFYKRLRAASPAPYAAFLKLGDRRVISSSPECFLRMSARRIETRPIKGTRPRFPQDEARDIASADALTASSKEHAELLMITDLERNDLGQVCEFGSIKVPELAKVEKFAQVYHLVSTVEGTLRPEIDHTAAFKACFPGGSISGAPKKRALEIIAELESHPRGLYTGAIGYFGFNGESQFSIAIRTAVQEADQIQFHAGSGIVADSVPELEYEETLHKAAGILQAAMHRES